MSIKRRYIILRDRTGFTLMEILITLTVIGITAALTAPALMSLTPSMELKSATQDLYSNLQQAKIRAIKDNRDVMVGFENQGYYYIDEDSSGNYTAGVDQVVVLGEDVNGNSILDAGEDMNGNGMLDINYRINYGTGSAADDGKVVPLPCVQVQSITFNGRGLAAVTPAGAAPALPSLASVYIDNQNADIAYAIEVRVAGSIKTRKYNGAIWID